MLLKYFNFFHKFIPKMRHIIIFLYNLFNCARISVQLKMFSRFRKYLDYEIWVTRLLKRYIAAERRRDREMCTGYAGCIWNQLDIRFIPVFGSVGIRVPLFAYEISRSPLCIPVFVFISEYKERHKCGSQDSERASTRNSSNLRDFEFSSAFPASSKF